ncbi:MAG: hypothetical protein OJF58_001766 [Enhydrobacter sp.]|nr:MAG: hypothetical protein OJF58_001766 [Enhydrobacter sp.]
MAMGCQACRIIGGAILRRGRAAQGRQRPGAAEGCSRDEKVPALQSGRSLS